jgi:hypothetical protein
MTFGRVGAIGTAVLVPILLLTACGSDEAAEPSTPTAGTLPAVPHRRRSPSGPANGSWS